MAPEIVRDGAVIGQIYKDVVVTRRTTGLTIEEANLGKLTTKMPFTTDRYGVVSVKADQFGTVTEGGQTVEKSEWRGKGDHSKISTDRITFPETINELDGTESRMTF